MIAFDEMKGGILVKKVILALLVMVLLLLMPLCSFAESSTSDEFIYGNGIKFAMTKEEVESIVGMPDDANDAVLAYMDQKVAGKTSSIGYIFDENYGLYTITIQFSDTHTNNNDYIDDFEDVDAALLLVYPVGEYTDFYYWKDDLFKDDASYYGLAVASGQLIIGSLYTKGNADISHILVGDNYSITHAINYTASDYTAPTDTSGL